MSIYTILFTLWATIILVVLIGSRADGSRDDESREEGSSAILLIALGIAFGEITRQKERFNALVELMDMEREEKEEEKTALWKITCD